MANGEGDSGSDHFGALSLYQLIGAPLHALVEAEAQAAMATARFVELVGFEGQSGEPPAGDTGADTVSDWGRLRVARFHQRLRGPDGRIEERTVEIPTLSLVPIPALQIKNAELEYVVKIIDTEVYRARPGGLPRSASKEVAAAAADGGPEMREHEVDLKVAFARDSSVTSGRRSLDMQVKMKVNVEQADLPSGIARLINLMDQGVQSGPARPVIESDEEPRETDDGGAHDDAPEDTPGRPTGADE